MACCRMCTDGKGHDEGCDDAQERYTFFEKHGGDLNDYRCVPVAPGHPSYKVIEKEVMKVPDYRVKHLGHGKDVHERDPNRPPYDMLQVAGVWKVDSPSQRVVYSLNQSKIKAEMDTGGKWWSGSGNGAPHEQIWMRMNFDKKELQEHLPEVLDQELNEKWLLHGLSPDNLATALRTGMNERYSDGLLGKCLYLTEDVAKMDQYPGVDISPSEDFHYLHKKLYGNKFEAHPGRVCYCLLVRATLGFSMMTTDAKMDDHPNAVNSEIFAFDKNELRHMFGSMPNIPCHSVVLNAVKGGAVERFREIGVFNGEAVLPVYLIAYRRCLTGKDFWEGGPGPKAALKFGDASPEFKAFNSKFPGGRLAGFKLTLVDPSLGQHKKTYDALKAAMEVTDKHNLGTGRDADSHEPYDDLEFVRAWRIESRWVANGFYDFQRCLIHNQIHDQGWFWKNVEDPAEFDLKTKLDDKLLKELGLDTDFSKAINEKALLHGTSPETLTKILRNGFSEKFSGGLLGKGIYLSEDPSKIDQYSTIDRAPSVELQYLHEKLYEKDRHPGKVFYCLVTQAALGFPVHTKDAETVENDPGQKLFATDAKRELTSIPGSMPAVPYHSLVAKAGPDCFLQRHREFCIYHARNILPRYIIAYRRHPTRLTQK